MDEKDSTSLSGTNLIARSAPEGGGQEPEIIHSRLPISVSGNWQ
jgi:hypothetical protein